jgi:hypothetical protein
MFLLLHHRLHKEREKKRLRGREEARGREEDEWD